MLIVKNLKLLVELYQFLPNKKQSGESKGRNHSGGAGLFNTIQMGAVNTPLDALQREAIDLRQDNRKRTPGQSNINKFNSATLEASSDMRGEP